MPNKITIISRKSRLAVLQVEEIVQHLNDISVTHITVDSPGDRDKKSPLTEILPDDFFTRDIDQAVIAKNADIAVHSAKDMPVDLDPALQIVALTTADDASDAFVNPTIPRLEDAPAGFRLGISSERRKTAALTINPQITPVPIRGNIGERLALIEQSVIDGLIVATCALKRLKKTAHIAEILDIPTHPLQGMLAVVARKERADLIHLFAPIDCHRTYGKVTLMGGGAGNPEWLTVKAWRVLRQADSIYYDELVDEGLLREFPGKKIYVGKCRDNHSHSQDDIHALLYKAAVSGESVVRLKGGDPLIFGRGGEEMTYLAKRHVPFEVIPGITTALAGAASFHFPLTMRKLSNSVAFLTGHYQNPQKIRVPDVDTLVYYMAASNLKLLSQRLIDCGRNAAQPVALLQNPGLPEEICKRSTIVTMPNTTLASPLLVIVGDVTGAMLSQRKLLYTGIDPAQFKTPYTVVHYPLILVKPMPFAVDMSAYDAILFTSKFSAHFFLERQPLSGQAIYVIGPSTKKAVEAFGYTVSGMPGINNSQAFYAFLEQQSITKALYPCSSRSDNALHSHPAVQPLCVYKTQLRPQKKLNLDTFCAIAFTSPSTVDSFLRVYGMVPANIIFIFFVKITRTYLVEKSVHPSQILIQPLA